MTHIEYFDASGKEFTPDFVFWKITDREKIAINIEKIYDFLNHQKFYVKFQDDLPPELYRLEGKFVDRVFVADLAECVRFYISVHMRDIYFNYQLGNGKTGTFTEHDILEAVLTFSYNRIFTVLNFTHLNRFNIETIRHTRDKAYYFFKNGFVEVTQYESNFKTYKELHQPVFRSQVIDRDIQLYDIHDKQIKNIAAKGSCFLDYLQRISDFKTDIGVNDAKLEKYSYLIKLIGFMCHSYKEQGSTDFAPIFCDNEAGGSGKGLLMQSVSKLINTCVIPAEKLNKDFDPLSLSKDTKLKVYNDTPQNFNFRKAYDEITDNATITHKYGHQIILEHKDSFKIAFTMNFVMKGSTDADFRRQRIFTMSDFFNKENSVAEFYGHSFFSTQWSAEDWNYFYNVMFFAVGTWLKNDYAKLSYEDPEYIARRLESNYFQEFRQYFDDFVFGLIEKGGFRAFSTGYLYSDFKMRNVGSTHIQNMSSQRFSSLRDRYIKDKGHKFTINSNRTEITIYKK